MSSAPNPPVCRSGASITSDCAGQRVAQRGCNLRCAGPLFDESRHLAIVGPARHAEHDDQHGRRGGGGGHSHQGRPAASRWATPAMPATAAAAIGTAAADAARATAPSAARPNHRRLIRASSARSSSWSSHHVACSPVRLQPVACRVSAGSAHTLDSASPRHVVRPSIRRRAPPASATVHSARGSACLRPAAPGVPAAAPAMPRPDRTRPRARP